MKALGWIIGLFALAVGLTLFARLNTGYALLFVPPWRIEVSLNAFVIALLLLVLVLFGALRLVVELGGLPERVRTYRADRRRRASVELEREARIAFFEGRYQRAERLAADAFTASADPASYAVNGLLAARAAHAMRDFAKRDHYFERLRGKLGPRHLALAMTMAELYLDERRYDDADRALGEARELSPKLTAALKLELRLRQREGNPEAVIRLVDQLAKSEAIDAQQARRLRIQAQLEAFSLKPRTLKELKDWWSKLSDHERAAPPLVLAVADAFRAHGAPELAREAIEEALASNWSGELAERYGTLGLEGEAATSQLQQAEAWLKSHPHDHLLLLTLGRLCCARGLWGKAQTYLEASLAVEPTAIAHAELAELLESLDRHEDAARHFRASLALALATTR
ncbi:heme biosynthesis protein HemY [Chitiniphilus shinanonensis]|uniref:Heme biosynthesis protein HemY n=1 Tax=Chitiniphilus shinanonensis TaxID=553088 RepID=A0ABQ6BTP0_9NEIS|nr:heme biosynthesis HemY N-terminal domain-containing protein [Chitiniphilus shinanonensis]GLS04864.1 heme biosynthesis protein HemY [Chitiniphilus shinanonensis]